VEQVLADHIVVMIATNLFSSGVNLDKLVAIGA
jgi:hypothetical protein